MEESLRILMLEDVSNDALLIERELHLARVPFQARCVLEEKDFLAELDRFQPDIILSDFSLPRFDAMRALKLLQERRQDVPFILVTGSQSEEVAVDCIKKGADDYILKSSLKRLPSAMLSVLRAREAERKREEAVRALRRSADRFRSLIENASDIITIVNPAGVVQYESPSVERVLGYKPDELIGRNVFELIHPNDRLSVREAFEQELRVPGTTTSRVYRFRHKDGSWRVLESVAKNLMHDAEVSGLVANSRDVTERKLAEDRIHEQAALLDKAKDAILVHDLAGRLTFWNKSAERLYGWTANEALRQDVHQLLNGEDGPLLDEARAHAMRHGEWHGELHQRSKSGDPIVVESSWTLVNDRDANPQSMLVINTDITARKKLETQFLRIQRMESIGTLAGGIAHDLNNVLTPITVAIKMLRDEIREGIGHDILDTLEASVHRGAGIVQQVLSFARGIEGERTVLQVKHPLAEVVSIAKETFSRSIHISSKISKELWPILGDSTQLHQVFMNICVNARDAMPHGGRLHVEAENVALDENYARMQPDAKPGPYVVVTISDSGFGIPPDLLEKIFEPFFTTKDVGKGTGLGLSTALGILKSHDGFLNVYSEPGKGTRFKIYLPAAPQVERLPVRPAQDDLPRGHGELILVADDEIAIREMVRLTLQANGYRVLAASDGAEAVALFAEHRHELKGAIIDVMMPFMDGPATIRALHKLEPALRCIAISGLMDNDRTADVANEDRVVFLAKPFTTEQILLLLNEILKKKTLKVGCGN